MEAADKENPGLLAQPGIHQGQLLTHNLIVKEN